MGNRAGFTIVELLIVIVVIAILAAITIVAYNGIRDRSLASSVQSALAQANKKVLSYAAINNDLYPATLADAGVTDSGTISYQYSSDNALSPRRYAITASNGPAGSTVYYMSSTQSKPTDGIAPGHNTIVWDKSSASAARPLSGGVVDTSVFRSGDRSMRVGPNSGGISIRTLPMDATPGQVFTISLWIQTDSNWNGTAGSSKIRFSDQSGSLLTACSYNGAKPIWVYVSCSVTVPSSGVTKIGGTINNDGSTGNIWLDDISLSIQ